MAAPRGRHRVSPQNPSSSEKYGFGEGRIDSAPSIPPDRRTDAGWGFHVDELMSPSMWQGGTLSFKRVLKCNSPNPALDPYSVRKSGEPFSMKMATGVED
ncbi:hypothetical protein MBM_00271 [Drepanopeziza brunnea f. sp. 'multigermtubi' MB_m1]|uniref:Uncharacterized protein n=1 Tax=Marssonina brunnea f. sp. multigermtubi (strain MB_m1) TaxID=1072389 RepID=K1XKR1_MARBU|nr:uncharacterized protein MBM_00271 [Drepanopeziza brunnea f. sp. 'multigermtubi' MB_m1]EKD21158.1 hypothetical protein MBM_00271 [Drepanopeziza brunnea f. sp. 'multigermtubi' MB_m1]